MTTRLAQLLPLRLKQAARSRLLLAGPSTWVRAFTTDIGSDTPSTDLSQAKSHAFQAETSKLLQIVASSLYSERKDCAIDVIAKMALAALTVSCVI